MTKQLSYGMESALNLLTLAGKVTVRRSPSRAFNEISIRTASALERRGWVDRIYTGQSAGTLVLTVAGRLAAGDLPDHEYDER
ncbi:hypothetical protein [Glaciihabitans sp. UYNi722]|uniref:hypothetical protein n=1 Tax=Glaciihabitans sp. UYNi722 TaxID=3156344 RepID=UPI0033928C7D